MIYKMYIAMKTIIINNVIVLNIQVNVFKSVN